jgi:protein subunit release factor B
MSTSGETREALEAQLRAIGVNTDQLIERFVRASGPGGQNVNKTSTAVQLRDPATGFEVRVQGERSQHANRLEARRLLIARIEQAKRDAEQAAQQAREKRRRQRRQPSKAAKKRMVETKRRRAAVKRTRGTIED